MKKWVAFLFICLSTNNFSQTNVSPQYSELKGIEDQQGNTHLFYRIGTSFLNPPLYQWSNHIYHMDLFSNTDTLFIIVSGYEDPINNFNKWVSDIDYWNNNPAEFIYCGGATSGQFFEGSAYIRRYDGYINDFGWFWGTSDYVDISQLNDSLLYAGIITDGGPSILRSLNGGRTWDSLSTDYQFLSLCSSNENIYFVENTDRKLFRTTDSGNTFNLVDPEFLVDTRFYYDPDGQHIYRVSNNKLKVSDNSGAENSWSDKYSLMGKICLSVDYSSSGTIYLANNKNIFISIDYGNTFTLYKTLDRKIVGIYRKPNSNKLYAATKYKIYEITPDTIQVIKSLPIPEDAFTWLPLNLSDMWFSYHETNYLNGDTSKYFLRSEVVGYKLYDSKIYIKELQKIIPLSNTRSAVDSFQYFRIDSINGFVYRAQFQNDSTLWFETFLMDLIAEVGDTIPFSFGTVLENEEPITQFGVSSLKRTFRVIPPWGQQFELVKGFGLVYDTVWTSVNYVGKLMGCVIDGVMYGDTTVVSVDDEENPIATSFKLEQNYPNPFNPSTKIKFTIPQSPLLGGDGRGGLVTLKVYDVLGNEIATLVNEKKQAGEYEVEFNASELPSGIYFYQLKAGSFIQTNKMVLLK